MVGVAAKMRLAGFTSTRTTKITLTGRLLRNYATGSTLELERRFLSRDERDVTEGRGQRSNDSFRGRSTSRADNRLKRVKRLTLKRKPRKRTTK